MPGERCFAGGSASGLNSTLKPCVPFWADPRRGAYWFGESRAARLQPAPPIPVFRWATRDRPGCPAARILGTASCHGAQCCDSIRASILQCAGLKIAGGEDHALVCFGVSELRFENHCYIALYRVVMVLATRTKIVTHGQALLRTARLRLLRSARCGDSAINLAAADEPIRPRFS